MARTNLTVKKLTTGQQQHTCAYVKACQVWQSTPPSEYLSAERENPQREITSPSLKAACINFCETYARNAHMYNNFHS